MGRREGRERGQNKKQQIGREQRRKSGSGRKYGSRDEERRVVVDVERDEKRAGKAQDRRGPRERTSKSIEDRGRRRERVSIGSGIGMGREREDSVNKKQGRRRRRVGEAMEKAKETRNGREGGGSSMKREQRPPGPAAHGVKNAPGKTQTRRPHHPVSRNDAALLKHIVEGPLLVRRCESTPPLPRENRPLVIIQARAVARKPPHEARQAGEVERRGEGWRYGWGTGGGKGRGGVQDSTTTRKDGKEKGRGRKPQGVQDGGRGNETVV
ncbi:hypothetical protein C8R44DRAFT_858057 [Mycena epipterygia]|nr:hypothetical protein C8R44DRAFT_858057 [Mycena epipterygia]